jgi:hypothetical protein
VHLTLILAVSAHVLSAAAWAGFTFAIALTDLIGRLMGPQLGAAAPAVATGGWFWSPTHGAALAAGVVALLALTAQAAAAVLSVRALARPAAPPQPALIGQRVSTGLIALTLIAMASARYV